MIFSDFLAFGVGERQHVVVEIIDRDMEWIPSPLYDRYGLIALYDAVRPGVSHEPEAEGG